MPDSPRASIVPAPSADVSPETLFRETTGRIPAAAWEARLDIGAFRTLSIGPVMRRPFSLVARCEVRGEHGTAPVYLKVAQNGWNRTLAELQEGLLRDDENMRTWAERFGDHPRFRVVRPLLVLPELLVSATHESRGASLFDIILNRGAWRPGAAQMTRLERTLFSAGEWLAYKDGVVERRETPYDLDTLVDYIDLRLNLMVDAEEIAFGADYRDRVRRFMERARREVPADDLRLVPTHNDLNPGNLLIDGDVVTGIDFGAAHDDHYLLDLVKLYHQVSLFAFKPKYFTGVMVRLQRALLAGYGVPDLADRTIFKLLFLRYTISHLWAMKRASGALPEKLYNRWVLYNELRILDRLMEDA